MKTIGRNRLAKVKAVFDGATECVCYSLSSGFRGVDCNPEAARRDWNTLTFAKLRDDGNGKYSVKVHSNLWYEIKSNG